MPGVVVQSSTPSNSSGYGPSHSGSSSVQNNGAARSYEGLSVLDIRQRAKDSVNKEAKGVSAVSLIKTARTQILAARDYEANGDLQSALTRYIRAATLTKMAMDSQEYLQENRGKGGVVRRELDDFMESDGLDLIKRTNAIEDKLKVIETKQPSGVEVKGTAVKSIKDRLKALQDSGLTIEQQPSKSTRDHSSPLPSPRSPQVSHAPNALPSSSLVKPSASTSTVNSNLDASRVFVPPSSLGPPSPPSESPSHNIANLDIDDINGFNLTFPSLDELDNDPKFSLPSVPITPPVHSNNPAAMLSPTFKEKSGSQGPRGVQPISPIPSFRNYIIPIERPYSTPITPIDNSFPGSRPPSPSFARFKPSGLSNDAIPRLPLPIKNTVHPKELASYIKDYTVLLIDIRHRADFDREHIKSDALVCIEPSVLLRDGITAEGLENAMVIGPRQEARLFRNREKFDLIAVYDSSSSSFEPDTTPLSVLLRLIWVQALKKILKRSPVLLIGGIEAWKKEFGENEIVGRNHVPELQQPKPSRRKDYSVGAGHSNNPFANGLANSVSLGPSSPRGGYETSNMNGSPEHISPLDVNYCGSQQPRRVALNRRSSSSSKNANESIPSLGSSFPNGSGAFSPISYPQFPSRPSVVSVSGSISSQTPGLQTAFSVPAAHADIASPPQASINSSQSSSRKRSDYVDQSQEALLNSMISPTGNGFGVDYPGLSAVRPPPPVASPLLSERQDNRPGRPPAYSPSVSTPAPSDMVIKGPPKPPRINSDYPVSFWSDVRIGVSGLKNLGNTCYMNAPIQCLSATVPFARFFTDGRWKTGVNFTNPLGSKGQLTGAFAKLLHDMWGGDLPYLTPIDFRKSICSLNAQYLGSDQHDSQEFLSFLIDGIHEDLNRIMIKPTHTTTPEEEAELERLPSQIGSEKEWRRWKSRNDSLIVDFFQGQFRNRLECLTCHKTSTTYNVFSILSLPIPNTRSGKVPIQRCLDAFFNEEVLEKDDAWDCPKCRTKVRASKKLSLARLPPILVIHLKRFEVHGRFSDKVDTFVDFPMRTLDLTNYMPPLPHGADNSGVTRLSSDDPRTQLPPYQYDLYGVTNHYGNLSSGHYTAFIASKGGWLYCDDSSVKPVDSKQVVNQKAYVLFYKRVRNYTNTSG